MKSPHTLLVLFIFISFASFSQNIGFGILGGPNYYTTRVENIDGELSYDGSSAKKNIQYHFGGFVDVNFSGSLGVIGNIIYQKRGLSLDPDVAFDYLDISPLLKFDVNNSYGSGFYLKGGIRYSLLLSAKTFEGKADVKDAFKNSNFGLVGGFGADAGKYLGIELLVDYSPMNIFEDINGEAITSRLVGANIRILFYFERVFNNY